MHQKPITLSQHSCLAGVGYTDSAGCTMKEGRYRSQVQLRYMLCILPYCDPNSNSHAPCQPTIIKHNSSKLHTTKLQLHYNKIPIHLARQSLPLHHFMPIRILIKCRSSIHLRGHYEKCASSMLCFCLGGPKEP